MLEKQDKMMSSNNSSTEIARLSVPPARAELFLERLANLDSTNDRKGWKFAETFRDLLPPHARPPMLGFIPDDFYKTFGVRSRFIWNDVQPQLRNIWKEPAPLLKEAGMMMLAATYMKDCEPPREASGHTPYGAYLVYGPDKFLMVLIHALKHVHLLRYCANPECKEPFFVARRGSQIYCSSPCAKPAQTEAKLKWWREHGAKARKKARNKRGKHGKAKKA